MLSVNQRLSIPSAPTIIRKSTRPIQGNTYNSAATTMSSGTNYNLAHTIANHSDRELFFIVSALAADTTSFNFNAPTFNGVAMTLVGTHSVSVGGNRRRVSIYRLEAPSVGTYNIVFSETGATVYAIAKSIDFYGVNQTTPINNQVEAYGDTSVNAVTSTLTVTPNPVADSYTTGPMRCKWHHHRHGADRNDQSGYCL